jgi:hypothetical protein
MRNRELDLGCFADPDLTFGSPTELLVIPENVIRMFTSKG